MIASGDQKLLGTDFSGLTKGLHPWTLGSEQSDKSRGKYKDLLNQLVPNFNVDFNPQINHPKAKAHHEGYNAGDPYREKPEKTDDVAKAQEQLRRELEGLVRGEASYEKAVADATDADTKYTAEILLHNKQIEVLKQSNIDVAATLVTLHKLHDGYVTSLKDAEEKYQSSIKALKEYYRGFPGT